MRWLSLMTAIASYLRQHGESETAMLDAAELKLRAERRLGELLADMPKHDGNPSSHDVRRVADLGVNYSDSSRWQRIATIPDERFESHIAERREVGELTTAGALRLAMSESKLRAEPQDCLIEQRFRGVNIRLVGHRLRRVPQE